MLGLLTFIGIFVIVIGTLILSVNTYLKKSNEVDISLQDFQRLLKEEGLSDGLINFCTQIIKKLQIEEGERASPNISYNVINKLNSWDYSSVFGEQDYIKVFENHKDEINALYEESMQDHGFMPADVGEAKHTEGWNENAIHTEAVVTQKISDAVYRYKKELV